MRHPYNFADLSQGEGVIPKRLHNISAVKLLIKLDSEHRHPTEPERDILARFVGWGTVASVINREVLDLLPSADLNSDNAFQTSREVIEAIWTVVEHLGFLSGRILEPAANIGLFPGFQNPEYRSNSEWVMCEVDPTAAAIARNLHPDALVYGSTNQQRIGFENADIPAESFDLVISNFPFGLTAPFDLKYIRIPLSLHNYFWRKSFDLTAPGGIIAAITSTGTMDSTPDFCQELAQAGAKLVGVGKTFSMIAAAYEAKRLGIANKPILVVLNSTITQIVSSFKALYPTALLLVADDSSFKERNKLVAKIQTGSYDAIILTHTQFFAIPISTQTKIKYIQEQLDIVERYLGEAKDENDRLLFRELQRQSDSLSEQIEELSTLEAIRTIPAGTKEFEELLSELVAHGTVKVNDKGGIEYIKSGKRLANSFQELSQKELDKKRAHLNNSVERATSYYSRNSVAIDWESLGCDWLMLDEAHCSKNIWFPTKITGTSGITNVDTQRSLNTLMKFRYLWENGDFIGGGTGTWPSNSISEMFNLMRLFAPDELQRTQTEHFDSWLGQFGETSTKKGVYQHWRHQIQNPGFQLQEPVGANVLALNLYGLCYG